MIEGEQILDAVNRKYPDIHVPDERVRRVSAVRPFLELLQSQDGWSIDRRGKSFFALHREQRKQNGSFSQQVFINVPRANISRIDTLKVDNEEIMPKAIIKRRNVFGMPTPQVVKLTTSIAGELHREPLVTEYTHKVQWSFGDRSRRYGGSIFFRDSHKEHDVLPNVNFSLGLTNDDVFTPRWIISDTLPIDMKRSDVLHIVHRPERVMPVDFLHKFSEIFLLNPAGKMLDVFANLARGIMYKSINAPNIPDHPALFEYNHPGSSPTIY